MEQAAINRELHVLILEDAPTDAELMVHELRQAGIVFTSKRVETRDDSSRRSKNSVRTSFCQTTSCPISTAWPR